MVVESGPALRCVVLSEVPASTACDWIGFRKHSQTPESAGVRERGAEECSGPSWTEKRSGSTGDEV